MKPKKDVTKWQKVDSFINQCMEHFGSMNKNDYEVALFYLLILNEFTKDDTDFTISVKLQIPESKVKRLRYEMSLKYPKEDDELDQVLLEKLIEGDFKIANEHIQFCINDKLLRLYVSNKLTKANRFADSSFNSNIVSISASDFVFLLKNIKNIGEKERKEIVEATKEKLKQSANGLPLNGKEKFMKYGKLLLHTIGGPTLSAIVDTAIKDLDEYIKKQPL